MSMDANVRDDITTAGIAAPSADNSQPWRFAWRDDTLDLSLDASRIGGPSDNRHVLSDLAAGACLENMVIRGQSLGFAADVRLLPGDDELRIAHIDWREETGAEPLAEAIAERHTDRRFPWKGPVPADTRARLAAQAESLSGVRLHWLDTGKARRSALAALRQAEALRFRSPSLHAELFSSIRFASGWHGTCAEGLPPATLAVEAPVRPLFKALRKPAVMAAFNRLGAAPMLGFRSVALPVRLSPGLCLLSIEASSRESIVTAGRALERVWLQATLDELAVQPFAAAGVLSLGFARVEPRFDDRIARLQATMRPLCPGRQGIMFLRLGRNRTTRPCPRTGRRSLDTF